MKPSSTPTRLVVALALCGRVLAHADAAQTPQPLTVDPVPVLTRADHIRVEGRAAPKQQVKITGGAAAVQTRADSRGKFDADVHLARDRTNTLQLSTDEPSARLSVTITQDSTPPQIVIDSPREDGLVFKPRMHITGHVTDNLSGVATISCGDAAAIVSGTQFSCDMPVGSIGGHRIKIWSSDAAGNTAVVRRRVVSAPPLAGGDAHTVALTADINGDRNIDVVRTDFTSGEVVIQLGNGDGTFQAEKRVPVGPYPSSLALADINCDGILDLVRTHYTSGEAAIQYGQADGSYVRGPRFRVGMWPSAAAVADMDQDGKLDLITAHLHDGGLVRVHLARANGSFESETTVEVGKSPHALAVGDVFGDGKQDVVVANYLSNDVSLLRARGNGHFYPERRIDLNASAVGPTAIMLADLDRDGALDIVTANFGSNDVTVLNGLGLGRFKPAQAFAAASQPIAVTAWEVTGDDKLDLVIENLASSAVSVLSGQSGEMFGALEALRNSTPLVTPMPARTDPEHVETSDPATPSAVQAADLPSALFPVTPAPAAGLAAPLDRVGMSFGAGSSDYAFLMGPNGMSYVPLTTMDRAGVKWIRLEGDASYFVPGGLLTYQSMAKTIDDLIAHGYNIHIVVSDWQNPYPTDFPNAQFLARFTRFAGDLARVTNRPGHVVYEVWNEPNLLGSFWPLPRCERGRAVRQTPGANHGSHSCGRSWIRGDGRRPLYLFRCIRHRAARRIQPAACESSACAGGSLRAASVSRGGRLRPVDSLP